MEAFMKNILISLVIAVILVVGNVAHAGFWPGGTNYCKIAYVQQSNNGDLLVKFTYDGRVLTFPVNSTLSESVKKNILATLLTAVSLNSNVHLDTVGGKIQGIRIFP